MDRFHQELKEGFERGLWRTTRRMPLPYSLPDRNSFITSNIILTLDRLGELPDDLKRQIEQARPGLGRFQSNGLGFFWEVEDGQPTFFHSRRLGKLMNMSPDADCTCLIQLCSGCNPNDNQAEVLRKLEHHRFGELFKLIRPQRSAYGEAQGTYLVWFPDWQASKERLGNARLEVVDAVVAANTLWYLNKINRPAHPGAEETRQLLELALRENRLLQDCFLVSPYYPKPAIALFMIARALVWGELTELSHLQGRLSALGRACNPRTQLDRLCLLSLGLLLDDRRLIERYQSVLTEERIYPSPVFIGHFGLGKSVLNFRLARLRLLQFQFESEPLQAAMMLWAQSALKESAGVKN